MTIAKADKPLSRSFCEENPDWLPVYDCPLLVRVDQLAATELVLSVKYGDLAMHLWCANNCTAPWSCFGGDSIGGWDDGFVFESARDFVLFKTFFADHITRERH
jgi:hypothetical protein